MPGRAMQAELEAWRRRWAARSGRWSAIVGGAKVSTKLDLLGNLINKVDTLVIGGGMANTFLLAQGMNVGKSLCEHDLADTAREIMAKAKARKLRDLAAGRRRRRREVRGRRAVARVGRRRESPPTT